MAAVLTSLGMANTSKDKDRDKRRKQIKSLVDQYRANLKREINNAIDAAGKPTDLIDSLTDACDFQSTTSKAKPKSKKPGT
jgi:hypothetical protein